MKAIEVPAWQNGIKLQVNPEFDLLLKLEGETSQRSCSGHGHIRSTTGQNLGQKIAGVRAPVLPLCREVCPSWEQKVTSGAGLQGGTHSVILPFHKTGRGWPCRWGMTDARSGANNPTSGDLREHETLCNPFQPRGGWPWTIYLHRCLCASKTSLSHSAPHKPARMFPYYSVLCCFRVFLTQIFTGISR